ncbi:MAG: hypothetical protein KA347_02995 [Bacteroidia bacterium]|jgi:hypothetical protein|nr:hypothetical protein [Bacteroidota bacterium]MBP6511620.1 hypothetical protein [Bacteroidia bacterium]MBP7244356.1 hypothetical protein [Bacteroidia bacterium]
MKTNLNPRAVFLFLLLSSATYQVQAAITSDEKVVKAARFENTWIPSIQLQEVEISASRSEGNIVEATSYEGSLIPSIQMNEVTIKASGIYDDTDIQKIGFVEPVRAQYLTEVVLYNGEYIPRIQLQEVNVEATAINTQVNAPDVNSQEKVKEGVLQVNARQTFNVLIDFIITKSMEIVRHFVPISTAE